MEKSWIKNFAELATTENRKIALSIAASGLEAINTAGVMQASVILSGDILSVQGETFNLDKFKRIKVVGFGKSSCEAAAALEKILGFRITEGAVIGLTKISLEHIETFAGSHPRPSEINLEAGRKIYEMAKDSTEEDLIIALVSGGGSALLCHGENECEEGIKLYDAFLQSGKTITEINTVRKHLSLLKGGGLAKMAYPATVIGLIFSDVPGDAFENVASGPTYQDVTSVADAQKIITENNLGDFILVETPKENKYFEKVHNFVLVSNTTAVTAMAKRALEFNLKTNILSTNLYDEVSGIIDKIFFAPEENSVILAAGEPSIVVPKAGGKGGRNLHVGLWALENVGPDSVFISLASDGMDNSDVAGAVVDKNTLEKAKKANLDIHDYLNRFDSYNFFQKTGDLINTGPTGANVSDLMLLLTKK